MVGCGYDCFQNFSTLIWQMGHVGWHVMLSTADALDLVITAGRTPRHLCASASLCCTCIAVLPLLAVDHSFTVNVNMLQLVPHTLDCWQLMGALCWLKLGG